jgi:hypothetical protein
LIAHWSTLGPVARKPDLKVSPPIVEARVSGLIFWLEEVSVTLDPCLSGA